MAGEADWLCAGKYYYLSGGKSSREVIQKGDLKLVNPLAALAEFFLPVVLFQKEKILLNIAYKIAAVYEQICSGPHIFLYKNSPSLFPGTHTRPSYNAAFFIHNFPHLLGRNTSLFFFFYAVSINLGSLGGLADFKLFPSRIFTKSLVLGRD